MNADTQIQIVESIRQMRGDRRSAVAVRATLCAPAEVRPTEGSCSAASVAAEIDEIADRGDGAEAWRAAGSGGEVAVVVGGEGHYLRR